MRTLLRTFVSKVLNLLPAGTPDFIYIKLLRGPLRTLANHLIMSLVPASIQLPEGLLFLNPQDPAVSGSLSFGVYEPFETKLFREIVKPGMTVVDIGANIGLFTIIASKLVGENGRVIAFEPAPINFGFLQKSIEENGFQHTLAFQKAVSDKEAEVTLNLYNTNQGAHSIVRDRKDTKEFVSTLTVSSITLDSFLSKNGFNNVDVIKMDIEGAESLALMGMSQTLTNCKFLFTELTPSAMNKIGHSFQSVLDTLRSKGFTLYKINEREGTVSEIKDDAKFIADIDYAANLLCKK